MSNYKQAFIFLFILCLNAFMLAAGSDKPYIGVDFDYNLQIILFNILNFCCLSTLLKTKDTCLFKRNILSLVRNRTREKALLKEICQRLVLTAIFTFLHTVLILLFEKRINPDEMKFQYILYGLSSLILFSFLMLLQLAAELWISSNAGYFSMNAIYVASLITGKMMYDYCSVYNNGVSRFFTLLNRINIINYFSLLRTEKLKMNLYFIDGVVLSLFILVSLMMIKGIKKMDILDTK